MKHTKTDPVCIHYKEAGPFRRYLNARGRGKACLVCVPWFKPSNLDAKARRLARDSAEAYMRDTVGE